MDQVPKIIIRNHCYICEKVPRQLMNLVSKIIIRNQCYFHFSFSSSSLTIFFFFINHYYTYNILVSPKSKITERRTKTDWIDGRTDWMNEYRIYNPILVSSPGLLSLRQEMHIAPKWLNEGNAYSMVTEFLRIRSTVKILRSAAYLYTSLNPQGIRESENNNTNHCTHVPIWLEFFILIFNNYCMVGFK